MSFRVKRLLEHTQRYGVEALSTADLLALILCSAGSATTKQREKALQLIEKLLAERETTSALLSTDIYELFDAEFENDLASRLTALLELHRRLARPGEPRYQIRCPGDAARLVMPEMQALKQEQMRVLLLDTKNCVISSHILYKGTVNCSVLRVAELFRPALVRNCPAILVCHNHPSGDPEPSKEDRTVTEQIVEAGKTLDIELADHLIIGEGKYVSLKMQLRW